MDYRLDEIDRRILHALMRNARDTSAPMIAEDVNVSAATVRNRIHQLEDYGIIRGYTTNVDFERAEGQLTNLYLCNVPVDSRERLAKKASAIPGVINVRELMTGRRNLHVLAVGEDTNQLRRISQALSELGIEIEDEDLVRNEIFETYAPFGPDATATEATPTDFISLTGDANVVEVTVRPESPISDHTLEEANERGILSDELLVIAIERDDSVLTPRGKTTIRSNDIVTVLSRGGIGDRALEAFLGSDDEVTTP